ncbi:hypothetical protein L9F63_010369, partial [Diploptera punctata]
VMFLACSPEECEFRSRGLRVQGRVVMFLQTSPEAPRWRVQESIPRSRRLRVQGRSRGLRVQGRSRGLRVQGRVI